MLTAYITNVGGGGAQPISRRHTQVYEKHLYYYAFHICSTLAAKDEADNR